MKGIFRKITATVLIAVLIIAGLGISNKSVRTGILNFNKKTDTFTMTMLDVGQGLCILMQSGDHYMIYDGGGRDASSYVVSYLKKHDIDKLDYMIASHYDADHISGLIGVLNTTDVEKVLTPNYKADTETYQSFQRMLKNNGAANKHPSVGKKYSFGDAKFQILNPKTIDSENENNNSLAIRITNGSFSAIITGDAAYDAECYMLNSGRKLDSDVYVVGHHGSSSSSYYPFVKAISPDYALISVGADNSYGHPTEKTLEKLKNNGAKILRTDLNGEITITSDGTDYDVSTEQKASQKEETSTITRSNNTVESTTEGSGSATDSSDAAYVLNENTHKFHLPECQSVKQMKEKNKTYSNKTRQELIDEGYDPCQNCKP